MPPDLDTAQKVSSRLDRVTEKVHGIDIAFQHAAQPVHVSSVVSWCIYNKPFPPSGRHDWSDGANTSKVRLNDEAVQLSLEQLTCCLTWQAKGSADGRVTSS